MKKNSNKYNFQEPTRQSYVAILMIIWKTYTTIVKQAWPFLIIFFLDGSKKGNYILWAVVFASVFGMVYSIINYFRYYFYIEEDELVIESGVFVRKKLNVPFDRIQTINFEQNIVHRMFEVVRLKVDTAGSAKAEFEFQAIDEGKADTLRNIVLSRKSQQSAQILTKDEDLVPRTEVEDNYKTIMGLNIVDLLKAGLVENHLKSGGFILAFMFWIWQSLDDVDMSGTMEDTIEAQLAGGLKIAMAFLVIFLVLSFLVSLVRMVIVNFDLKFMRSKRGFKIQRGLFTRQDVSALDHKIQVISWGDNLLKKLIGVKDLTLKQASSIALSKKTSIKIPSCTTDHIDLVKHTLYGEKSFDNIAFEKIDKRYFYRNGGYMSLFCIVLISLLIYLGQDIQAIGVGIIGVMFIFTFYLSYKKKRYGFNQEMVVIRGGAYGDKTEMMPIYKIQTISRTQTPYQKRNNLASLVLNTASGRVGIPYILNSRANEIMNIFLYRIEVDKRKWF